MSIHERSPRPGEDDLDWLIRRVLQRSVANAEPHADLWRDIRRDLSGGLGPRQRELLARPRRTGSPFIAAILRLSGAFSRVWPSPLSSEAPALMEQRWTASFVLLGFAPLGRVY
jgi:hypothetical protein